MKAEIDKDHRLWRRETPQVGRVEGRERPQVPSKQAKQAPLVRGPGEQKSRLDRKIGALGPVGGLGQRELFARPWRLC